MSTNHHGRILITGGAGFIGSALCWALNLRGRQDIVLSDRLGEDESWRNLLGLRYTDYVDADDLLDRLEKDPDHLGPVSLVLHLGACSATTERDAGYLMRNNFEYTKRLAHWSLDQGARFVYASSAATYGDGTQGMDDRDDDLSRLRPLNMYGYSKHLFDTYAQATGIASSIIGLKYFNVYGPNEDHKAGMRSVVGKAFDQIREQGKVQLFKSEHPDYRDGEQMRDFLYIKDAVEMTLHLALNNAPGGLYNLGSGTASTWIQLVTAIFESLGLTPNIEFIDLPEALKETYQYYTCADITKLREAGYDRAVSPLPHAVYDYVANYLVSGAKLGTIQTPTPAPAPNAQAEAQAEAQAQAAPEPQQQQAPQPQPRPPGFPQPDTRGQQAAFTPAPDPEGSQPPIQPQQPIPQRPAERQPDPDSLFGQPPRPFGS